MVKKIFFIVIPFCAVLFFKYKKNPEVYYSHYQNQCEIMDLNFKQVLKIPGVACHFFNNGSTLVLSEKDITFYDKKNIVKWRINSVAHHNPQVTLDENFLFFLTSQIERIGIEEIRYDVLNKLDMETYSIEKSWHAKDNRELLEKNLGYKYIKEVQPATWANNSLKKFYEFLHFNSVYIIPPNAKEHKFSYLKAGNLVVSAGVSLVLFFSRDLELLKILNLTKSPGIQFHDMQITPEGDLLLYRNFFPDSLQKTVLQKINLDSNKVIWQFPEDENESPYYSECCGSVQILKNGNILFTDNTHGGRFEEIDKDGNVIFQELAKDLDPITGLPAKLFAVKKINLQSFFKNRL